MCRARANGLATEEVQKDICARLGFTTETVFRQSYERKNLSYSVFKVDTKLAKLVDIVKKVTGTAIVYCKSRKRTVELAALLQMHGLPAHFYHAGLAAEERGKKQQDWIENKVKIIVCTNAFGMGIDKPDVRLVIHADMPDCLENYYQEAGRAGRDGKKSYAVLLCDEKDATDLADLHKTRYPSLEEIRKVYGALVNYLQVPVGYGDEHNYSFKFDEFIRNFKLKATHSLYALKALEADGWIYFNEKNLSPASIVFTCDKEHLQLFSDAYPHYKELITTLLRTYEGIFDYPAYISENVLAKLLRTGEMDVKKALLQIDSFNTIRYTPQNTRPQIIFRERRPAVEDLTLNLTEYNKRKAAFIKRGDKMIGYTRITTCRSTYINQYFGDKTPPCGICDACLNAKRRELSAEEFKTISILIEKQLAEKSLTADELLDALSAVRKEKVWTVMNFLIGEKTIIVNGTGSLDIHR
jgi:ATP-dependent DNA helicase RecQ